MKKQWKTPTLEVLDVKNTFSQVPDHVCAGPAGAHNPHCQGSS